MTRAKMRVATAVAVLALVGACASAPRGFSPLLSATPADAAAFRTAFDACAAMVAEGRQDNFGDGRATSGAGGAAIGGAAAVATGASAASGAGMLAGAAAGAGLAIGMVVFAPLAVFGVSRAQRAAKERRIKAAMETCLRERGFEVTGWALAHVGEPTSPVTGANRQP